MADTRHETTDLNSSDTDVLDRFLMSTVPFSNYPPDGQGYTPPQRRYTERETADTSTSRPSEMTMQFGSGAKIDNKRYDPKYQKFHNHREPQYVQLQDYEHNTQGGSTETPMTVDGAGEYQRTDQHYLSSALYTETPSASQSSFLAPPFETNSNCHSFLQTPPGGATNFRRDLNYSRNRTFRFDAKYPQGPIGGSSIASVGRLPTVKEDFASDWLADIPEIGSVPHLRFSQENISDAIQSGNYEPELAEQVIKLEQISPTQGNRFSFSRTSSTGSIHAVCGSSASSTHNTGEIVTVITSPETTEVTDDEDSDTTKPPNLKERRREAHTQAEQKRRDAIKKGYDDLQMLVPTCTQQADPVGNSKLSKAAILQRSIDYMQYLLQQKKKQEDDLESLRKEVTALKIMKANYEHIVKAHKSTPTHGQNQVPDDVKFQVYQQLMDSLFQSFNGSIAVSNFAELSGSVFRWLEEYCKPQSLRAQTETILRRELTNSQQQ